MVFIKKTTSSPAKSILEKWLSKRDIQALYDEPNQTGKKLWKLIRSKRGELNAALRLEQDRQFLNQKATPQYKTQKAVSIHSSKRLSSIVARR